MGNALPSLIWLRNPQEEASEVPVVWSLSEILVPDNIPPGCVEGNLGELGPCRRKQTLEMGLGRIY